MSKNLVFLKCPKHGLRAVMGYSTLHPLTVEILRCSKCNGKLVKVKAQEGAERER